MGISANQAKFLALTGRQCDLEYRMQNICQRRLNLSTKLTNAANAYNRQTSDRRLFINNIDSYTSSTGTVGGTTHDNLSDNQRYEFITPENLYDNGYYVIANGKIISANNGQAQVKTGNTLTFSGGSYSMGEWFTQNGFSYQITGIPSVGPVPSNLNTPTGSGTVSGQTTSVQIGSAASGTTYSDWSGGAITVNETGMATQTFTRTGRTESSAGTTTSTVSISQINNLGTSIGTKQINGVTFNEYTYTDYAGRTVTSLAIGEIGNTQAEKNANAILQLNALAGATGTINNNFILMTDVDMSSVTNWGIIDSFAGTFDGNMHTISNMTINSGSDDTYIGMFGMIEDAGIVKNVSLTNQKITVNSGSLTPSWNNPTNYNYIGSLAGQSLGELKNCSTSNLNMTINGDGVKVGGVVGESGSATNAGLLTNCSATGAINITGEGHQVGGLAGLSSGGDILFSSSNVNITTGNSGGSSHIGALIGDVDNGTVTTTNSIEYCYASGLINGNIYGVGGSVNTTASIAPPDSLSYDVISNCYYGIPGSGSTPPSTNAVYDGTPSKGPDSTADWDDIKNATTVISGQTINVWNPNGTLNTAAINTEQGTFAKKSVTTWTETAVVTQQLPYDPNYTADEYESINISSEELEKNLRNGTYRLAMDADMLTQNPVEMDGIMVQYVDWRTAPVINDDLYTANDEAAEIIYEKTVTELNEQDKKLQLEQKKVETEYTAVTSQKEAVKKILDNNTQSSFKYFG